MKTVFGWRKFHRTIGGAVLEAVCAIEVKHAVMTTQNETVKEAARPLALMERVVHLVWPNRKRSFIAMEYHVVINFVLAAATAVIFTNCSKPEIPSYRKGYLPPSERLIQQAEASAKAQAALLEESNS